MKKVISKILIVAMAFSLLCFYQAKPGSATKVYANGEDQTTAQEVTTQAPTTTVPVTTTVPTTTVVKKTPADVTNLKITDVKNASLKVAWTKSKLATSYIVYRSKETKNKMPAFKQYKTLTKTSFIDTGLSQGTVYKYRVVAVRKADGYTTRSSGKTVAAMTDVDPVKTFTAKAVGKKIKLKWKKNSKATKYYVYKSSETNGGFTPYKKLKTLSKKKTTYTDKKVSSGKLYQYKIVVYRKKFSTHSTSIGKFTTAMTSLSAPTKLTSSEKSTKITLKWNKSNGADSYEVYKGKKLIKRTNKLTYTVKNLKKRHAYQFKVRAVRKARGKTYKSGFANIYASTTVGAMKGTWVEVCIKTQTLKMYVKNKLYVKTPIVSGNVGDRHTSKGTHSVIMKASPKRLKGSYRGQSWDTQVKYWLQFTGDAQGIHDSTWRSAYGGNIYKTNGSHGCVNTPIGAMKKIYKKAYVGMPVIVY